MEEFEVTCKVTKGERAYSYTHPNYNERIIRCKDCKHFEPAFSYGFECYHIHPSGVTVEPNGFCAWGEERHGGIDG